MSDRVVIRDAIKDKIETVTGYTASVVKNATKQSTTNQVIIQVILGDEEVDEVLMQGVKYRCITEVHVYTRHTSPESADISDIQATGEAYAENIYNALMEWTSISTDMAVEVPKLDYESIQVGVNSDSGQYVTEQTFLIEYDKN